VNNNPQVLFTVLITPPGGQPYQAQLTKIVSLFEMSQYQVGAACQARIDPMNPQHVAIFPGGMGGAMMWWRDGHRAADDGDAGRAADDGDAGARRR
jgi:hypothetical protein